MTASALYVGRLFHTRHAPRHHAFDVGLYMLYLDLDELPSLALGRVLGVEQRGLSSFRRADYRGDAHKPLKEAVLDDVESALGERPAGPVRLLTHVRTFGYVFNPVSFYYCFHADGESLCAVLAEITNTPWGERHAYVLSARDGKVDAAFAKAFHVSPFFPMDQRYVWCLPTPGPSLTVTMQNTERSVEVFRAHLALERLPLSRRALGSAMLTHPWMTLVVPLAIYFQASRLWLKRTPFFAHPPRRVESLARRSCS